MRIMRIGCIACVLLCVPVLASAQTVIRSLEWDQIGANETLANVQAYTTTLKIDAGAVMQIAPVCTAQGPGVHCVYTPLLLASGVHTLTLTETNIAGSASTGALTYTPGVAPAAPTSITVTIKITVP